MVIASDYPFIDILGSMLVFFGFVVWFWLLITIFADLFRRRDIGGWGKAGWTLLVIVLPFVGVLAYLGFQGKHMAERNIEQAQAQKAELDAYVRETAGKSGATDEIARGKQLLDSGAITQAEFDQLKQKALA